MAHYFLVGTFNTPVIYTLSFDPESGSLKIVAKSSATSAHSWLALNKGKNRLYATEWREPPGVAAYEVVHNEEGVPVVKHLNSVAIKSRSGYVCCSEKAVYSAGGATGDVLLIASDGSLEQNVQTVSYLGEQAQRDDGSTMDFGGLRHGAHGCDLSPDGRVLFVPDIGRNCVWCMHVNQTTSKLSLGSQSIAPRPDDGPRHVWLHPNGKILYSLQEHTSMVDVFSVDGANLTHLEAGKIIPDDLHKTLFWADEVRLSPDNKTLFASTRGLEPKTKGWLAAWQLDASGRIASEARRWQTPTSGGWANAIEPAPWQSQPVMLALTDSEQGLVMIVSYDAHGFNEVARVKLEDGAGAATAVWFS